MEKRRRSNAHGTVVEAFEPWEGLQRCKRDRSGTVYEAVARPPDCPQIAAQMQTKGDLA